MANTIRIKRGLKADIDKLTLLSGELGVALDTQELYVGDANGNKQLVVGKASGTVTSAEKLVTARNISATGDATGTASFDGSQDIEIALTLANSGVVAGTYNNITVDEKGRITNISGELDLTVEIEDVSGLKEALAGKANANDLSALSTTVGTLDGELDTLTQTVGTKAAQSDLEALEGVVGGHTTTIATLATKQELTNAQTALQGSIDIKANSDDVYTKTEVDGIIAGTFHFKGAKNSLAELEALTDAKEGDVYQVADKEYAYNGSSWVELGFNIDLSAYATTADVSSTYATQQALTNGLTAKANSTDVYTKTETYTKTEVNTELNKKADSATTLAGYGIADAYTETEVDNLLNAKLSADSVIDGGTFGA